jgi:hypothetical protein
MTNAELIDELVNRKALIVHCSRPDADLGRHPGEISRAPPFLFLALTVCRSSVGSHLLPQFRGVSWGTVLRK